MRVSASLVSPPQPRRRADVLPERVWRQQQLLARRLRRRCPPLSQPRASYAPICALFRTRPTLVGEDRPSSASRASLGASLSSDGAVQKGELQAALATLAPLDAADVTALTAAVAGSLRNRLLGGGIDAASEEAIAEGASHGGGERGDVGGVERRERRERSLQLALLDRAVARQRRAQRSPASGGWSILTY